MRRIFSSIITVIFSISICLFVIDIIISMRFIIFENSAIYLFCTMCFCFSLLKCLKIIKEKAQQNKILLTMKVIVILLITTFSVFIIVGIANRFHRNPNYYAIEVENIPDNYEVTLYEFTSFRSRSGCLCLKINEYVYKKLDNTNYTIESGHSLMESDNLILEYVEETNEIIMKYRWLSGDNYTEKITRIE
ncbi:MAG: hypothetical protein K2K91_03790 [Ruminococcus sp.]|nr:hypothetical protein [Ruminococcus sp.]